MATKSGVNQGFPFPSGSEKNLFISVIFILSNLTICFSQITNEAPLKSKNVLLIMVDDLRPEINSWGHPHIKTPNIDALVEAGVSFKRAYAQYANCAPSRKSILTGLSPESTGHRGNFNKYDVLMGHTTMPGHFNDHGYFTACIGKVYHDARDDRDSWDYYYDLADPEKPQNVPWESYGLTENQQIQDKAKRPAVEGIDLPLENYNDYTLCQVALNKLEENKDKPFFLTVGFRKPHLPFAAPKKYWDIYDRGEITLSGFPNAPLYGDTIVYQWSELAAYDYYSKHYKAKNYRNTNLLNQKSKELRHGYYACVSFIDDLIGRLLNKLRELSLDENTIVIVIGDHGYHLGDQQIWGKHTAYDLSTRVPFILYDPTTVHDENSISKFVELLDIYPTLAELCGLSPPKKVDGKSLVPLIENTHTGGYDAAFNQYQTFQADPAIRDLMAYAIHTEDYNYIEWQDLNDNRKVVQRELYRVSPNRIEHENIVFNPENQARTNELSDKIEEYFSPHRRSYAQYTERLKLKEKID